MEEKDLSISKVVSLKGRIKGEKKSTKSVLTYLKVHFEGVMSNFLISSPSLASLMQQWNLQIEESMRHLKVCQKENPFDL